MNDTTKDFLFYLIDLTKDYVSEVRNDPYVGFYWSEKEGGIISAKFDYGRVAEGVDFTESVVRAIGNAIRAIDISYDEGSIR